MAAGSRTAGGGDDAAPSVRRHTVDAAAHEEQLRARLDGEFATLRSLAASGGAGGVASDATPASLSGFAAAREKLAGAVRKKTQLREARREREARGGGPRSAHAADGQPERRLAEVIEAQRGLLLRMLHSKLFREPTSAYVSHQAQADALLRELGETRWPEDVPRADGALTMASLLAA